MTSTTGQATRPLALRLADVPGLTLSPSAPLRRLNTFRIGGSADLLAEVHDEAALRALLAAAAETGEPTFLVGLGSNVLIPDDGLRGVVFRLAGEFKEVAVEENRVTAGGAVSLAALARRMASRGLLGLEVFCGFPSTVGGAVYMNAGCYGTEIKDVLIRATVVYRDGSRRRLTPAQLGAGYRRTDLQDTGAIVTRAELRLEPGDAAAALERIEELNRRRWASLPSGKPNVGSIFKNPPGDSAGRLIDVCGLKGERCGGARISPKHANVIVNTGGARAGEVLELMDRARRAVARRFGIELEPEVVLAGELRAEWDRRCRAGRDW